MRLPPTVNTVADADCPKCGARRGDSCRTPAGRKRFPHKERAKRAFRAGDLYNATFNPTGRRGRPT